MNFITFPVAATNLFPASNTTAGGQLVTEFNLKSRESVSTDSKVSYLIGHSFVHSETDFEVDLLRDTVGAVVNSYTLSISEGRGVINGHYVETLVPMTIDLLEANAELASQSKPVLKGSLAVGIRTFFATEQTIASSILVENEDDMYLGIQLVVLPENELITPSESPDDQSKVTADIRLATFTFLNNSISVLTNATDKLEYLSPNRIRHLDDIVSSRYVTKYGLNSKKLYVFAGKGTDPATGLDTWEDATDSMVIWDSEPQRISQKPTIKQAEIVTTASSSYLVLPHKQVTGMTDDDGDPQYYAPRILEFPLADYGKGSAGLVNKGYTDQIKQLALEIADFKSTLTGKQIMYMDTRSVTTDLPQINDSWDYGDYILVRVDEYYTGGAGDESQPPATMYVVLPGQVKSIQYITSLSGDASNEPGIPDNVLGAQIGFLEWYQSAGQAEPDTQHPDYYPEFFDPDDDTIRGVPYNASTGKYYDYFRLRYFLEEEESSSPTYPFIDYFYGVSRSGPKEWSDAVLVTGSIPFAQESLIGGFLNVSEEATDYGYVILDETGHLKLLDYDLLRSGTLAYQIGANISIPSGTLEEIQSNLIEYVNERVAFPTQVTQSVYTSLLHIYIPLTDAEEPTTLVINGIDSRFNTAVCLHIQGDATSNVTVNISDCEKLMIDPVIGGSPVINIFRCCLYYDPIVFNYIKNCPRDTLVYGTYTGFKDLKIWFESTSEDSPSLLVNDMTVSEVNSPIVVSDIDYWKETGTAANDNNYMVALRSITFSGYGDVIGCEILVANNSTDNVDPGDKIIVGDFVLPQGTNLIYPEACLTKKLKVSGSFTSAYYSDENWYVTDNSFSMQTGTYTGQLTLDSMQGTVAFHSTTTLIPSTISQTSIDVWEPDSFHVFTGGTVS